MNKILFIFVILTVSQCQEVVVQNWSGAFNSGVQFSKVYQRAAWDNILDFALFGWLKVNSAYDRSDYCTLFHFTSNVDGVFNNQSNPGDRVLSMFLYYNQIQTSTYSQIGGKTNLFIMKEFANSDVDKWAFFYVAFDSTNQVQFTSIEFVNTKISFSIPNVQHYASNYYKILIGQSFSYKFFPGSFYRFMIYAGPDSIRYTNLEYFYGLNPSINYKCAIAFTEYLYIGRSFLFCNKSKNFDAQSFTIKSIYVPQYGRLTVHTKTDYIGSKTIYLKSNEIINNDNMNTLILNGDIIKED